VQSGKFAYLKTKFQKILRTHVKVKILDTELLLQEILKAEIRSRKSATLPGMKHVQVRILVAVLGSLHFRQPSTSRQINFVINNKLTSGMNREVMFSLPTRRTLRSAEVDPKLCPEQTGVLEAEKRLTVI
jgi:hypothetical protein